MSTNILNQAPFLRTTRSFPQEINAIAVEVDRAYVDIANSVNSRVIGIFPVNKPIVNGKSFFLTNQRQQGLQQLFSFTAAGNIPHGINLSSISQFSTAYGSFTDGTNYYGAIYGSNVAIAGQVSFYISPTNIVVLAGAGSPAIVNGIIVIEWISFT